VGLSERPSLVLYKSTRRGGENIVVNAHVLAEMI